MKILEVVEQTKRRAGSGPARLRDTDALKQLVRNWRTTEDPERLLRRLKQLGLDDEATTVLQNLSNGEDAVGFNPLERIIGENQLISSVFLSLGAERTRAVGRIVTRTGVGIGTGFLISSRLLMTNNHVIGNDKRAGLCKVEFDYVRNFEGRLGATQLFNLVPDDFFLTSATHNGLNLDYTIVAVEPINSEGEKLAERGWIRLLSTLGAVTVLEWVNIIQHPGGEPQQLAFRDNKVVTAPEHFIRYEADTQPGSSGSPVFNDQWELVALHHSGVPDEVQPGVYRLQNGGIWDSAERIPYEEQLRRWGKVKWLSNEGIRIGSIIADARLQLGDDSKRQALFEEAIREAPSPVLRRVEVLAGNRTEQPGEPGFFNERYKIERKLGRGGFGITYLAHDTLIHSRQVVIKILNEATGKQSDELFKKMFERETKALSRVDHPLVVRIYEYGWTPEGKPFIVMQYIEGRNLRQTMAEQAFKAERAAEIVNQLGSALSAVHDAGVVHRDLKPENVMLQTSHDEEFAILIDFGIAKIEDSIAGNAEQETGAGTPAYMAPEQRLGHPVPASDIWALGVVAFELVTGRRPFSAANIHQGLGMQNGSFTLPQDLSRVLPKAAVEVILKALSYNPADRYQQAHEMGKAFLSAVRAKRTQSNDVDDGPGSHGSVLPLLAELLRRCAELFLSLDEFSNPARLNAFFSTSELPAAQKCVAPADHVDFDKLMHCLQRSGRNYSGQALVDVLSAFAERYKDDHRGKQCEELRDLLEQRLKLAPASR